MFGMIKRHAGTVGGIIILASMLWLMGVAGADNAAEAQGLSLSFGALLARSVVGFIGLGIGALVLSTNEER